MADTDRQFLWQGDALIPHWTILDNAQSGQCSIWLHDGFLLNLSCLSKLKFHHLNKEFSI
jgi:hypothetical protein